MSVTSTAQGIDDKCKQNFSWTMFYRINLFIKIDLSFMLSRICIWKMLTKFKSLDNFVWTPATNCT
jgi:hypothetical protein